MISTNTYITLAQISARLARSGIDDSMREARYVVRAYYSQQASSQQKQEALLRTANAVMADAVTADAVVLLKYDEPILLEPELHEMILKREQGCPLAYITGVKEFYGRDFVVDPGVLIPRSDTETLIDVLHALVKSRGYSFHNGLDIGSGSGCLSVTALKEGLCKQITAIDISKDACAVTVDNARNHGLKDDQLTIINSSVDRMADHFGRHGDAFDLIITNPPYIRHREIASLPRGIKLYEPHIALDGGDDGLKIIRSIMSQTLNITTQQATLLMEIGQGQERTLNTSHWQRETHAQAMNMMSTSSPSITKEKVTFPSTRKSGHDDTEATLASNQEFWQLRDQHRDLHDIVRVVQWQKSLEVKKSKV